MRLKHLYKPTRVCIFLLSAYFLCHISTFESHFVPWATLTGQVCMRCHLSSSPLTPIVLTHSVTWTKWTVINRSEASTVCLHPLRAMLNYRIIDAWSSSNQILKIHSSGLGPKRFSKWRVPAHPQPWSLGSRMHLGPCGWRKKEKKDKDWIGGFLRGAGEIGGHFSKERKV